MVCFTIYLNVWVLRFKRVFKTIDFFFFFTELIRESKLSIFQRKEVENSIKNGQPLPLPPKKTSLSNKKKIAPLGELKVTYMIPRRRKLNTIKKLGAFERDTFIPTYAKGILMRILFYT